MPADKDASLDFRRRIRTVQADITDLDADAIVTAANEALCGGGGVDGAVHSAAGPDLLVACQAQAPCPPGEARITPAFDLPAQYVIHAVGPVYRDGLSGEPETLHRAYRSALALAAEHQVGFLAFPCISAGVFGYPKDEACRIALDAVTGWLQQHRYPRMVTFCCYGADDFALYQDQLTHL